jgi:nitrogen-specific signal transduction histidine kinase
VSSERAGEQYVCIRVRDNGPGIDPEDLDHIFDPFFTKRDVGEGMGLGLSICHRILESHEGRIEVESDPGHFTVFSVMVPQPWQGDVDSGCETDSEDPESEQGSASRRESRSEAVELEEAWKK